MFKTSDIKSFFNVILAGESKTYDDHNWYNNSGLRGYIKGRSSSRYPLLNTDLSKYKVSDIMTFQARVRDSNGQLWATGRYQIIPNTLKGLLNKANVSTNDTYNESTQDKLGLALLKERSKIWNYLNGNVPDNKENLEIASLEMAKIWASIGVPYNMQGRYGSIAKNQSYYSGGGDKAHVKTEDVQKALRDLRNSVNGSGRIVQSKGIYLGVGIFLILAIAGLSSYFLFFKKSK